MRAGTGTSVAAALLLGAAVAQAQEQPEVTVLSVWNEPVSTTVCAPVATCSTLLSDLAPLLERPFLLEDPGVLADLVILLEHPEVVEDPAALDALLEAEPDLLENPDAVRELLATDPTVLQELAAMPETVTVASPDDLDALQLPPNIEDMFAGLFDLSTDTTEILVFTDANGETVALTSSLLPAEFSGPGSGMVAGARVTTTATGNRVEDIDNVRRSLILDSFGGNLGIVNVNQSSGVLDAQANVRVLAIGQGHAVVPMATLTAAARSTDNVVITQGGAREDRIENSFAGTAGLVGVNQTAGNLNQTTNVAALAIGIGISPDAAVLGESDLAAVSTANASGRDPGQPRSEVISGSFAGFSGIAQVTQSAGDGNIVRNTLTLSVQVVR